ncbi:MAG: hypothetical protein Q8P67_02435, partial [archaeon]|nr:hypothetical protein [archaeon]
MSKRVVPNSPPAKRVGPSADSSSSLPRRITATTIDTNVQVPEEARDAEGSPLFPLYVMVRRRLAPVGRSDVTSKTSSDSSPPIPGSPAVAPSAFLSSSSPSSSPS